MSTTTRDRLVDAMSASIQTRGMNATGISAVLQAAGAPKGVLYHHFPDGKSALTVAAIDASVEQLAASLERALHRSGDLFDSLEQWMLRSAEVLSSTEYAQGCPLATVALESTSDDVEIRAALATGFRRMREVIAQRLVKTGRPLSHAKSMAFAIVAAYEGGLLQARVAGEITPMVDSCRLVLGLMRTT